MAEVLNTTTEVTPSAAPEGHDAAMAAKFDQAATATTQPEAPTTTEQEELLLGKFKSADDLAKAYQELEKKLGQPKQEEAKQEEETVELTEETADELLEKSGIDVDSMTAHFEENGGLTDEHYGALEKAGIPRAYVDQYIEGVEATAAQAREDLFEEVGGQESFQAMSTWAAANLSEQELTRYNTAVESGDMEQVRSAVMGLAYRYQRDNGKEPSLVRGTNGGLTGYESVAQLTAAMKDPRYESDPAYRREVEQKLSRSNIM